VNVLDIEGCNLSRLVRSDCRGPSYCGSNTAELIPPSLGVGTVGVPGKRTGNECTLFPSTAGTELKTFFGAVEVRAEESHHDRRSISSYERSEGFVFGDPGKSRSPHQAR
jgi:hypothetical protein